MLAYRTSCQRYAKFKPFLTSWQPKASRKYFANASDAERFIRLGLDKASVHVTGSIKSLILKFQLNKYQKARALRTNKLALNAVYG
ncbi:hypothetical protein O9929_00725 [Vibrio lentus]|nr:hypothetical protein [Vibrio lentus]